MEPSDFRTLGAIVGSGTRGGSSPEDQHGLVLAPDSPLVETLDRIRTIADSGAPVLFWGEPGAGRRSLARVLHEVGAGAQAGLHRFKASPDTERPDLEAALTAATGGSLLIEEVSRLSRSLQESLADFLDSEEAAAVRIIATCPDEPGALIAAEELVEDLYYRIGVFSIRVPPLRERSQDIRPLTSHFIMLANQHHGLQVSDISGEALDHLSAADWPGNVPDLRRTIEHAAILTRRGSMRLEHLPTEHLRGKRRPRPVVLDPGTSMADAERQLILATLEQTNQNKAEAARRLGLDVKTIRNKLRSYGLM
ncbi:MAG: sigma 54-interacting transcriptional regulator [Longimicrobiales bacterium]